MKSRAEIGNRSGRWPTILCAALLAASASAATAELNRWTSIGPQIPGGVVHTIRIHPKDSGVLFAGTDSGVFISRDFGQTWVSSNRGLTRFVVFVLAIDPVAPSNLYAGTSGGIFKSADGGTNWMRASPAALSLPIHALAIDPRAPWTVSAGTDAGVLQTTDAGASWTFRNDGLTDLSITALAIGPTSPSTLLAGTRSGRVYRTTDAVFGWTALGDAPSTDAVLSIAIHPVSPDTIYAGTLGSGVFRSPTSGTAWTPASTGLDSLAVSALWLDAAAPARLFAATSGGGIFESTNGAASWAPVNSGLPAGAFVLDITSESAQPSLVYAPTASGLFRSTTGGSSWELLPGSFTSASVTALALDATSSPEALHAGAATGGVQTRPKDSQTWTSGTGLPDAAVGALVVDPATPGVLYCGTGAGFFVSQDRGASWAPRNSGLQDLDVHALAWAPPATLYAGTDSGVFKTVDGGRLWTRANAGITTLAVAAVVVDPRATATVFAAGNGGVFRSNDGGATWSSLNQGLGNFNIRAFAIDPAVSTTIYAGAFSTVVFGGSFPGGIYKSTNGGATWTWMTAQAQIPSDVQALAIDPASPFSLYVGTQGSGVFVSHDGGQTWAPFSDGLASGDINALTLGPGGRLWAGTTTGVFELTVGDPAPCVAASTTLCLHDNRFRVEVFRSATSSSPAGSGQAVPRTSDTGGFWFFSNDNTELLVKVLDGRSFNGHFWVFFASLTDVGFDLTVTDTLTGQSKSYRNVQGQLASVADTLAFAAVGGLMAPRERSASATEASAEAAAVPNGPCAVSSTVLCLNDQRFRVQVSWQAPDRTGGAGQIVPMSPNSGGFWFFDSANIELVVKVLDGRALNGRFWVFYGALSNVAYTITVTDTQTGLVRTYVNPQGQLGSVADTAAF